MAERVGQRVGALVLAGVFFFSTVALTGFVIWTIRKDKSGASTVDSSSASSAKAAANVAAAAKKAAKTPAATTTPKEGKLEGTKLAGYAPVASVATLSSTDTVVGTGAEVKASDTITAHYTGALAKDGTIFQSSHDSGSPFTSPLSGLIQGWQQGIPGMKVGGTRRLLIPAAQAYGSQSQAGIPANSDLVFDIELVSIK